MLTRKLISDKYKKLILQEKYKTFISLEQYPFYLLSWSRFSQISGKWVKLKKTAIEPKTSYQTTCRVKLLYYWSGKESFLQFLLSIDWIRQKRRSSMKRKVSGSFWQIVVRFYKWTCIFNLFLVIPRLFLHNSTFWSLYYLFQVESIS